MHGHLRLKHFTNSISFERDDLPLKYYVVLSTANLEYWRKLWIKGLQVPRFTKKIKINDG